MSVAEAIRNAAQQLDGISDTPRLDAELLMAHALDVSRSALLLNHMQAGPPHEFRALLDRRIAHEPIAYITRHQEFWGLDFAVTPDVLIPRADSETLVEAAIEALKEAPPMRILDLGTGSGALLLAALSQWNEAHGTGIDQSAAALEVAKHNARHLDLTDRATFHRLDWSCEGWTDKLDTPFDLILCNPPYVETNAELAPNVADYEPHDALFAGETGLDDYRLLIPVLDKLRAQNAPVIFEIGAAQAEMVTAIASENGFRSTIKHDLAGHPRAVIID
ncbi:peptide chain release factor N(5)-glutamine methyltransferase [Sphingorhabdus sp. Alg239-R122]|uniref:peptide chain release factor N(5)-glutamine methyltransferase n=1 Tax=Sphingorhabdus sp. Alg239-R122 TaxID=2305989 RepID=UPI0013DC7865|nr:peptide chain release factor N(5)-glutamine methyltransferase [Sphingorhabdus sp. Alg239-R122]